MPELLSLLGRHQEALFEIQIAERLDPKSAIVHHQAGQTLQQARRYDEAIREYRKAIDLDPDLITSYEFTAIAYERRNRYRESFMWRNLGALRSGDKTYRSLIQRSERIFYLQGKTAWLREVVGFGKLNPEKQAYLLATSYAQLGQKVEALKYLHTAYAQPSSDLLNLQNEPDFDSLRGDPRFASLVSRIGIPTVKFDLR
jgi:tetratricopeptide (TPR) repeat protein